MPLWMSLADQGSCAVIALTVLSGRKYAEVRELCRNHGWSPRRGMMQHQIAAAARDLGISTVNDYEFMRQQMTLARFLKKCDPAGTYLVHTKGHVFVVRKRQQIDPAQTGTRTYVGLVERVG